MATEQTLFSFVANPDNPSGLHPGSGLIADGEGNLYGTTSDGGAKGTGTVYELIKGANGYTQQILFTFQAYNGIGSGNTSGAYPGSGLIADGEGNLYGTTTAGGANYAGTVYELVKGANGYTQQVLLSFAANPDSGTGNATGAFPESGLTADARGNLYGTTYSGGANNTGVVYELVKSNDGYTQKILFSFAADRGGGNTTGANPSSGLIADDQGNLYGTTINGGSGNTGAVYQLTDTGFATACYCTGTGIRVRRAGAAVDVPVQDLRVGDLAVTASGAHRPIRWIGHHTMDPRRHPRPEEAQPIRIRAHAFGHDKPARDLLVSPGHSIAVDVLDTVLIPANSLLNGATIVQEQVERVTYWHVELDSHDLLIAEGLAAESYLDMGNRPFFAHATSRPAVVDLAAGPDADPALRSHADFCRPFHAGGPIVEAVRAQLRRRANAQGWRLDTSAAFAGAYLEVDGRRLLPEVHGLSACFLLPADARDIWLVSPTSVPREVGDNPDARALGLCLTDLRLDDGLTEPRAVALDDPLLCVGFHEPEPGRRWTAGRAHLPAALLTGLKDTVFLRLDLAWSDLPHWAAPDVAETHGGTTAPDAIAA